MKIRVLQCRRQDLIDGARHWGHELYSTVEKTQEAKDVVAHKKVEQEHDGRKIGSASCFF
jgi:hypothetical protein